MLLKHSRILIGQIQRELSSTIHSYPLADFNTSKTPQLYWDATLQHSAAFLLDTTIPSPLWDLESTSA
jgi:hypothetical protein